MIDSKLLLGAVEGGHLDAVEKDGQFTLLIGRKPILTIPAIPAPRVEIQEGNAIVISSGKTEVARIDVPTEVEAEIMADALMDCFEVG